MYLMMVQCCGVNLYTDCVVPVVSAASQVLLGLITRTQIKPRLSHVVVVGFPLNKVDGGCVLWYLSVILIISRFDLQFLGNYLW